MRLQQLLALGGPPPAQVVTKGAPSPLARGVGVRKWVPTPPSPQRVTFSGALAINTTRRMSMVVIPFSVPMWSWFIFLIEVSGPLFPRAHGLRQEQSASPKSPKRNLANGRGKTW